MSLALADAAERAQKPGLPTPEDKARLFKGTGVVVKGQQPGGALPSGPVIVQQGGGGVVLNFEAADLREVVRNILGDVLNESYTIDASVGRPGDDPHVVGHPARRADPDARDAAADERRGDGQGGRTLQDRPERRRRSAAT